MKKQVKRRPAPKKLRAIQTSRHWHVSHMRHTGHVLPRRNTSYPLLVMLVLCTGVFLMGWTRVVTADSGDYTVHTSVPGPAPTMAATIDTPSDDAQITTAPITVTGSCPVASYVSLYRNGTFSGVSLCNAMGSYQITTDLFYGTNQLKAIDYSFTDVAGPASNIVTVYYPEPVAASTGSNTSSSSSDYTGPITSSPDSASTSLSPESMMSQPVLDTNFVYEGFYSGTTQSWKLDIESGTPPYALNVDWGDNTHDLISRAQPGQFTVTHTYKQAGGYHGSYTIKITLTDGAGVKSYLQLVAIVTTKPVAGIPGYGTTTPNGSGTTDTLTNPGSVAHTLQYVWPTYGLIVLLLGSFWLGERQEFHHLRPHLKRSKRA